MRLRNSFYLLRHGLSLANERGLIVSSPCRGKDHFGLAGVGRQEVDRCLDQNWELLCEVVRIYSSDFLRARDTARIVSEKIQVPVETSPLLRERYFGSWDGTSSSNYDQVWTQDQIDATHCLKGVESVQSVAERMTEFIRFLDAADREKSYLIVSHGDPLQILLAAFAGMDLRLHRTISPIGTGELRTLA